MISRKKLLALAFIVSLSMSTALAGQETPTGSGLCDMVFDLLKENHLKPQKQSLLVSGENDFPYNIILENKISQASDQKFIILFKTEDIYSHPETAIQTAELLSQKDYGSTIVIAYGEDQRLPFAGSVTGSSAFAQSISYSQEVYALIVDLSAENSRILAGNRSRTSPCWMVRNASEAFASQGLKNTLPVYYLSQLARLSSSPSSAFTTFCARDIPAVGMMIASSSTAPHQVQGIIRGFIDAFDAQADNKDDFHYFMLRFPGRNVWFSEAAIVKIVISTILLSLLFIFMLGFINKSLSADAWLGLRRSWYKLVIILSISIAGFYAGLLINRLLFTKFRTVKTVYGSLMLQIILSTGLLTIYFLFESVRKKSFSHKSVDFMILISAFTNQFIFSLADISLFPLFFYIWILSILSLVFRSNRMHIILLALMVLPCIYYMSSLYQNANVMQLQRLFMTDLTEPLLLPLILLPLELSFFRILVAFKSRFKKRGRYAIVIYTVWLSMILAISVFNYTFYPVPASAMPARIREASDEQMITADYRDSVIFGETVRRLTIQTRESAEFIQVSLSSDSESPVLYSDNDYTVLSQNSVQFLMPSCPPRQLKLSYGTGNPDAVLRIRAYFYAEDGFYSVQKELKMGGER